MPKIKLIILASDMKEANYGDPNDCPITRALKRAGFHGWRDTGYGIDNIFHEEVVKGPHYIEMADKVLGMMSYEKPGSLFHSSTEPATDFDWELEYSDEE